jgi:dihydrofolate reductase/RimJ/RimL family protein N-acetyltransferase
MKCSVYIAGSLDGFVARDDGRIDWLARVERPNEDYGYARFFASIDSVIVGRRTYETALGFGWPYAGKDCVVLTRQVRSPRHGERFFAGDVRELVQRLTELGRQHAYVDGPDVIRQFLAAGLVHELTLSLIPVLLGSGIRLFGERASERSLALVESRSFESGLVQLKYAVDPERRAPLDPEPLGFRPLAREDLPLLHAWCVAPHARRWFERNATLAAVEAEYVPSIEGRKPIAAYVVLYAGRPIGMMEWMRFGDFPEMMPFYGVEDPEIVNCDVLIGEADMAHRGLAAPLIRRFLREIVFLDPRFSCCIIDPEVENKSAIRAYEKAGFRWVRTMPDDGGGKPIYLMELRRDELGPRA